MRQPQGFSFNGSRESITPIIERPEEPVIMGTNKTPPPSGTRQFIAFTDTKVGVPAAINAIVLGPTSYAKESLDTKAYNVYTMSLYIGVESFYGKPQDS